MAKYDILTERWIPVLTLDDKIEHLGLREVFGRSHELKGISDVSPLIEYSLYRLLQTFLMDALRPEEALDIEDILDEGRLPMDKIDAYIALCRSEGVSFDLFDKNRPFLQSAYEEKWDAKARKPIQTLDYTIPTGNNHVHFDHRDKDEVWMSYAEAARSLVSAMLFCTAGAQGYPSGVNGAPPYFALLEGRDLFETLCYQLIPTELIQRDFDEPPVLWRMKEAIEPKKQVTDTSWLLGMIFPTRRITLIPDERIQGVREVYLSQGINFTAKETWRDPCVAYKIGKARRELIRPKAEKAIWRNLLELLDTSGDQAPMILNVYQQLHRSDTAQMSLYGVETNNASYLQTMRHTLSIPLILSEDPDRVDIVKAMLGAADGEDGLVNCLRTSLTVEDKIPQYIRSQAVQNYYSSCERDLWSVISGSLSEPEPDLQQAYLDWIDMIAHNAKKAHDSALQGLRIEARILAKLSEKEKLIYRKVKKLKGGV